MSSARVSPAPDQHWDQIEQFLAGIAELAHSDRPHDEFAEAVLHRCRGALAASGGGVWWRQEGGFELLAHLHFPFAPAAPAAHVVPRRAGWLEAVGELGQVTRASWDAAGNAIEPPAAEAPAAEPPAAEVPAAEVPADAVAWRSLAVPVGLDREVLGVLELVYGPDDLDNDCTGNQRLLVMVADLFGDYLRRNEIRRLRQSARALPQYERLVGSIQQSLDLRAIGYALVNDARVHLGCDRVSVLVRQAGRYRTLAVSGVDTFDRRSPLVQSLEELSDALARAGYWLRYWGDPEPLPPQLAGPVSDYVDQGHAQLLDAIPLFAGTSEGSTEEVTAEQPRPLGVLVLESFRADARADEAAISRVARLAGAAIRNGLDYQTLPGLRFSRAVRRLLGGQRQRRRRWLAVGALAMSVVLMFVLIPARYRVGAEGELRPQKRRAIYAPADGEIIQVDKGHNQRVQEGDLLLQLRSPALELERQRLQGEYQATQKKLLAIASARLQGEMVSDGGPSRSQLAAQEQELQELLASLETQRQLVRDQQDQLTIRSPIDGAVLTWTPRRLLEQRPVQQGQRLLSVAETDGPWELELHVPDSEIGHVIDARAANAAGPAVTFRFASDQATGYRATVTKIAGRTEVTAQARPVVRVTAAVGMTDTAGLRPGAKVYAKIDCGTRSLGTVCFHRFVETLRRWLWL